MLTFLAFFITVTAYNADISFQDQNNWLNEFQLLYGREKPKIGSLEETYKKSLGAFTLFSASTPQRFLVLFLKSSNLLQQVLI